MRGTAIPASSIRCAAVRRRSWTRRLSFTPAMREPRFQLVEALHRTVIQTSREDQIIRLLALRQFAQHRDQPHAPGPERNHASLGEPANRRSVLQLQWCQDQIHRGGQGEPVILVHGFAGNLDVEIPDSRSLQRSRSHRSRLSRTREK